MAFGLAIALFRGPTNPAPYIQRMKVVRRRAVPSAPRERIASHTSYANPPDSEFALGRNADLTNYPAPVSHPHFPNPFRRILHEQKEVAHGIARDPFDTLTEAPAVASQSHAAGVSP